MPHHDSDTPIRLTRRTALKLLAAASAGATLRIPAARARSTSIERRIPSTGEKLPVIGLGTSYTFDVGDRPAERAPVEQVLKAFVHLGGTVVDTSPTYGTAEAVLGTLAHQLDVTWRLFLATKVHAYGREAGIQQMRASFSRLRTRRVDLIQVHNLIDVGTQLRTLRQWKAEGRIRYVGITHYLSSAFGELERLMRREDLDFVQFNYSIAERGAEERLLPLATDRGIAVLVNRPFQDGALFRAVRGRPLPDWASQIGCTNWGAFFLKYIVAHDAVTSAIPATANPRHLRDNMQAGVGVLPDRKLRRRMVEYVSAL